MREAKRRYKDEDSWNERYRSAVDDLAVAKAFCMGPGAPSAETAMNADLARDTAIRIGVQR
jgi:hypothetical protein